MLDDDEHYYSKQDIYHESAPFPCWCSECNKECNPMKVDVGIGGYEFWGDRGYDGGQEWQSDCCEANISEEEPCQEEEEDL